MCSPPTSMPWLLMCSLFHPFTLYKCVSFLFFALYIFILSNFLCYVKLCLLPFYMHTFKCPLLLSFLYILYTFLSATYDYPLQPFGKQVLNNLSLHLQYTRISLSRPFHVSPYACIISAPSQCYISNLS